MKKNYVPQKYKMLRRNQKFRIWKFRIEKSDYTQLKKKEKKNMKIIVDFSQNRNQMRILLKNSIVSKATLPQQHLRQW